MNDARLVLTFRVTRKKFIQRCNLRERGAPRRRRRSRRIFLHASAIIGTLFLFAHNASAQRLELSGGYAHVSGDFGTNGFDAGAAYWFTERITLAANYDGAWNDTNLGIFDLTNIGAIRVRSHIQNFIVGPRIFFSARTINEHTIHPFFELQFGVMRLNSSVRQMLLPTVSASDTAFCGCRA